MSDAELIARAKAKMDGVTQGPWRSGKLHDSIVADHSTGHDNAYLRSSYGGFLLCESVKMPENAAFILSSRQLVPDLIAALEAALARELVLLRKTKGDL